MPDVIAHVRAIDHLVIGYHPRETHSYLCALVLNLMDDGPYGLSYSRKSWQRLMLDGASLANDTPSIDIDNSPFYGRAADINAHD